MQVIDASKNAGGCRTNSPLLDEYKVIIRELRSKNQQQGNEVGSTHEVPRVHEELLSFLPL